MWFIALVFAATTAMAVQAVWWSWEPVQEVHRIDDRSRWDLLYAVFFLLGRHAWARWLFVLGTALVALAAVGVVLQRAWGFLVALACSASLVAWAVFARYIAVFSEPRQYVSRSQYVQLATLIALVTVAGHGAAGVLGVRLLCRKRVYPALARLVLGALAALLAGIPGLWVYDHFPGGARNAVMVCACAAAALAALVACCLPKRGPVLASIGVSLAALAVLVVGLVLHLHDRPARGRLYSVAGEQAIAEVVVAAPFALALIGVCLVLRRQRAMVHGHESGAT